MSPSQPSSHDTAVANAYEWASIEPDRIALIQDDRPVTFGALISRSNAIAHHLRDLGLSVGDAVAGFLTNELAYWELILATHQIGVYYVPINSHLKPDEVSYIVKNCDAKVLVASPAQTQALDASLDTLPEHKFTTGTSLQAGWRPYTELGANHSTEPPLERTAGATMGYTSGTTGRPKGVKRPVGVLSPEQAISQNRSLFTSFNFTASDGVHLACSPLYHAAPSGFALIALHSGHTVVVHEKFDAAATLRDIDRYRVTNTHMVPTHFHRLISLSDEEKTRFDGSSLQIVWHAGAPCPLAVKQKMLDWWGDIVWEYLGATEGIVSIVSPTEWKDRPGTLGRPKQGTVRIVDEQDQNLPAGTSGRIFFKTSAPFEYLGDPEKTAANRLEGYVTTGDLGHLDEDGFLFMQDRRNDLILSGGVNVYPAEVEQALLGHPAINDIGVIGVEDDEWGQKVVAVIQLKDGIAATETIRTEIEQFARAALGSHKRPKRIEFLAEFPRTPSGKLVRRTLRDIYAPAPDK